MFTDRMIQNPALKSNEFEFISQTMHILNAIKLSKDSKWTDVHFESAFE